MRIAEIAVVGSSAATRGRFIRTVCDETILETESLVFGRLEINEQLAVHVYGLDLADEQAQPGWELVAQKLLGYVVLFDWGRESELETVSRTVDRLCQRYPLPLVITANLPNGHTPIPPKVLQTEFALTDKGVLTFCRLSDPDSVKRVLITLVDTILEHFN